jgi:hypothetical protein
MEEERKIRIEYPEKFLKSLKKLPNKLIEKAYEKENIFKEKSPSSSFENS